MVKCKYCGEMLKLTDGGWVHLEGGAYMMRCKDCGWQGAPHPSPVKCPKCGSKNVIDLHCALPGIKEDK